MLNNNDKIYEYNGDFVYIDGLPYAGIRDVIYMNSDNTFYYGDLLFSDEYQERVFIYNTSEFFNLSNPDEFEDFFKKHKTSILECL